MISLSEEIKQKCATKNKRKCYRDHANRLFEAKELLNAKQINLVEFQRRGRTLTHRYIKYHEENQDDSDLDNDA